MFTYSHYERSRFWAVYEDGKLLCVTVYMIGAMSVIERITGVMPPRPHRKKREKPALAEPRQPRLSLDRMLRRIATYRNSVADR